MTPKEYADWLYGVIVMLVAIISPVAAVTVVTITWIKNRGLNKQTREKVLEVSDDITDLKEKVVDNRRDVEKLEKDYHDLIIFLLDRK